MIAVSGEKAGQQRPEGRREQIIEAAKTVFVRDGYFDTRLVDIAAEAGCSVGTVYTYFEGRDALLEAVFADVEQEMRQVRTVSREGSPAVKIAASNRDYLESYRKNSKFMGLLEQVSQVQPEFRKLRAQRSRSFVNRNAAWLRELQRAGEVDSAVDVDMMSAALSAMVSRIAYAVWVDGDFENTDATLERVLATVNRAWWSALGICPDWITKN